MMKCAECGVLVEDDNLIYNDDAGVDVCEDCDEELTDAAERDEKGNEE